MFIRTKTLLTPLVAVLGIVLVMRCPAEADERAAAAQKHFEQEIRPVLLGKCLKCHGEQKQEGNLRLDSRAAILEGGDSGAAIVPGAPAESLLIEAIRYESLEMPPTGRLADAVIRQFETWIANQAPWPEESETIREETGVITPEDRRWWAFQPLAKPLPPDDPGDTWSRTPIDRFVHRRLKESGMQPAPEADKATLLRRLYFNLLGVPPTPEQLDAFVQDSSEGAWEKMVDRLLSDARYGEHWARFWLDLVRYSESDGWNQDAYRPHIWRYRDYVVRAFNEDKPYSEFVREQLAGDEIQEDDPEHLAAAGFLRLGIYEYNQRDARGHWNDIMNEMTDVAGDVFLGMSMACARCHDHKFDPVLQVDYFKLRAFFEPVIWRDDLLAATAQEQQEYQRQLAVWQAATEEVQGRIAALLKAYYDRKWDSTVDKFPLDIQACFHKPVEQRDSWDHQMAYLVSRQYLEEGGGPLKDIEKDDQQKYEALLEELAAFDHLKPQPLPELMTVTDFPGPAAATVIPDDPEASVIEPGILTVLSTSDEPLSCVSPDHRESTGRRTALADWIGRPDNPLTTRVIVNRIWQQHFGEGIVSTPSDFGHNGQPPSHPDLLDWLTVSFVEDGWSLKQLHKRILMSSTWRQSALHPQAARYQQLDPAEQLRWRAPVRRLQAEQIRDAMLSVTGELNPQVGGPSGEADSPRRALYVKTFRNKTDTFLHAFDMAAGLKSVAARNTTTTPTQALLLINGEYTLERARVLADRLRDRAFADAAAMLQHAIRLTWGRPPTRLELDAAVQFVCPSSGEEAGQVDPERLVDFCHVLFNSNEFLYLD